MINKVDFYCQTDDNKALNESIKHYIGEGRIITLQFVKTLENNFDYWILVWED